MIRERFRTRLVGQDKGQGYGRRAGDRAYVPKLRPGQVECPVCLNGVAPTTRGVLRSHLDLEGYPCANRLVDLDARVDVLPGPEPVVVNGSTAKRTGQCIDCLKWVPGERTLCGQCGRKREEARRRQ